MHKKKKRQKKRKFVRLEWHATLSAMRTWIGEHPDTQMNSRIRVSADPPDRQMPVSAACVRVLKNLVNLVHLCGQLSASISVNLRFHYLPVFSWCAWRFNPIRVCLCGWRNLKRRNMPRLIFQTEGRQATTGEDAPEA